MKVLLIGGTGNISKEVSKLAVTRGMDLYLLNRGNRPDKIPESATLLRGDIDSPETQEMLADKRFDAVVNFIVFRPEQAERDIRLFNGKCGQYVEISTACIYEKPLRTFPITESAHIANTPWDYAENKIACEEVYHKAYCEKGFPITFFRPSHTYSEEMIPTGLGGGWAVASRMLRGKPVIVHGDGLTLWTITHSRDVAKGIVGILGNTHAIGEAVHCTTDEVLTWDDIYNSIARALGVKAELVHISTEMLTAVFPWEYGHFMGDTAHTAIYDNTKIKRLVPGFEATVSADEGIRESVQYHLDHPELQREDPNFDALCDKLLNAREAFFKAAKG